MPNWCSTVYKCTGRKSSVKKLYEALNKLKGSEKSRVENDFGNLWLGNVVEFFGGDWEKICCRGVILNYKMNDTRDILTITQETAWSEQGDFRRFLEFTLPGLKIYYQEEEPMEDLFYTNDNTGLYFPEKYILDGSDDVDTIYEYYTTLEDVIKGVETITKTLYTGKKTVPGLCEFLDEFNERPENIYNDIYCNLREFKYSED